MYGNAFKKCGVVLSSDDFDHAESILRVVLPDDLKTFLLVDNGGVPIKAYWPIENDEFLWVKRFLSLKDSQGNGRTIEETYKLGLEEGFLPETLLPFARDHGGNFFCINANQEVCFFATDSWDFDLSFEKNVGHAKRSLGTDLAGFINGLTEEGY